jgi:hypothetical protein
MAAMSNEHLWPDDLDALHAAPGHHTLLFENESVRVLDTHVLAGQTVPLHTHRWPAALYILSWSHFVRRDGEGAILVDSRMGGEPAEGLRSGPPRCHRIRWKTSAGRNCG